MNHSNLSRKIKELALKEGFDLVGISLPIIPKLDLDKYENWIQNNRHAEMKYMENSAPRKDPQKILEGAKSIICCAINYNQRIPDSINEYKVARYALGKDYHKVVEKKLKNLWKEIKKISPDANGRYYVDTGPILERAFAQQAGLGWIGKNTMLISKIQGSYIFLGEIISDLELEFDSPATNHCGSCTACLDACPTKAFIEPGVLDARLCISYWTIEHRGEFPKEIEPKIADYLFGCDICQEVCPWNKKAPETREERFSPLPFPTIKEIVEMNDSQFSSTFNGRPLKRAKMEGLRRNAEVIGKYHESKNYAASFNSISNSRPRRDAIL